MINTKITIKKIRKSGECDRCNNKREYAKGYYLQDGTFIFVNFFCYKCAKIVGALK